MRDTGRETRLRRLRRRALVVKGSLHPKLSQAHNKSSLSKDFKTFMGQYLNSIYLCKAGETVIWWSSHLIKSTRLKDKFKNPKNTFFSSSIKCWSLDKSAIARQYNTVKWYKANIQNEMKLNKLHVCMFNLFQIWEFSNICLLRLWQTQACFMWNSLLYQAKFRAIW